MTDLETSDALRRMVREVLQEVLPRDAATTPTTPTNTAPAHAAGLDVRRIRVRDDHDLAALVTQVLNLASDPERVADLRSGRLRFTLTTDDAADIDGRPAPIEVDRGAVTERIVQRAAREQRPLRIGRGAVVTPLARDRARALGVAIDRTDPSPQEREKR